MLSTADLGNTHVVAVPPSMAAAEALHVMYDKKISSVAVVDEHGKLIDSLSASDLRVRSLHAQLALGSWLRWI